MITGKQIEYAGIALQKGERTDGTQDSSYEDPLFYGKKGCEIYRHCTSKEQAFKKLALWHNDVEAGGIDSFKTIARSIQNHYLDILNFFKHRSTNAAAESFNAKIKAFRATSRGVRDVEFFLFRLANIYA